MRYWPSRQSALFCHVLLLMIASSYVTLGVANPGAAASAWAPYAIFTFILALINLINYRRLYTHVRSQSKH